MIIAARLQRLESLTLLSVSAALVATALGLKSPDCITSTHLGPIG